MPYMFNPMADPQTTTRRPTLRWGKMLFNHCPLDITRKGSMMIQKSMQSLISLIYMTNSQNITMVMYQFSTTFTEMI